MDPFYLQDNVIYAGNAYYSKSLLSCKINCMGHPSSNEFAIPTLIGYFEFLISEFLIFKLSN